MKIVGYISGFKAKGFKNGKFKKANYYFGANHGPLKEVLKNKYKYEKIFPILDAVTLSYAQIHGQLKKKVRRDYGPKCKYFHKDCVVCKWYAFLKWMESDIEVERLQGE